MKNVIRTLAAAFFFVIPAILAAQSPQPKVVDAAVTTPPGVDVWFDRSGYQTFDKATVYFNAEPGAYVVVVRVTPRGTLEVLYPSAPNAQTPYLANSEGRTALKFRNDGIDGVGEISAMASATPFDFSKVSDGSKWNARRLSHPTPGIEGSFSSGFFTDISGAVGSRYGLASALYAVGGAAGSPLLSAAGSPTALEAYRAMAQQCRSQSGYAPVSHDPSCVAAYMVSTDPKPKLGGKPAGSGSSESQPVTPAKKQ